MEASLPSWSPNHQVLVVRNQYYVSSILLCINVLKPAADATYRIPVRDGEWRVGSKWLGGGLAEPRIVH